MAVTTIRRDPQRLLPKWLQVATIVILMVWLLPVLYMLIISISPDLDAAAGKLWPSTFVFSNYIDIWSTVPLARGLMNSFIAAGAAGLIATVFGLGAAYCLTRFRFRGRGPFLNSLVGLQSVPGVMIILPLFVMFSSVGSTIGVQLIGTRPALIDGCSRFGALRRIIFPLAIPGMVIVLVFSFLVGWNDILFANVLTDPKTATAAVQLNVFAASTEGGALPLYGQLMAASLITSAPVVILYMLFQRQLVGGLTAGGDKG